MSDSIRTLPGRLSASGMMATMAVACGHVAESHLILVGAAGADADYREAQEARVVPERLAHGAADHHHRARVRHTHLAAAFAGQEALVLLARDRVQAGSTRRVQVAHE